MASASKAFSSSSSSSSVTSRKRKYTREQLLRNLELIGDLGRPLSPNLPPSPPASRSASPVPGNKRKFDSASDPDAVKRPRTNSTADRSHSSSNSSSSQRQQSHQSQHQPAPSIPQRQQPPLPSHTLARSEPCEDGEVREEPAAQVSQPRGTTVDVPIRRPRKGSKPKNSVLEAIHDRYHSAGRKLKYSGDARFWSTYPPTHKEYRPLPDPPPPNSPYHKHGGLIARLELLDALVCFTYAIWNRDLSRTRPCIESWQTLEAFLDWCRTKWHTDEGINEAEKAFFGLIWMFESFIQSKKLAVLTQDIKPYVEAEHKKLRTKIAETETEALSGVNAALLNGKTAHPMLPSPNSVNSTPDNRNDSTPKEASGRPAASVQQPTKAASHKIPKQLLPDHLRSEAAPLPPHVLSAFEDLKHPITPGLFYNVSELTTASNRAANAMLQSQMTLHLPLIKRCFPKTWARMMYTTLTPGEEYEPDIEDEDGELFWPDQGITGQGIGWLCLMGKAMIKEFGKAYGYKGLDGVVPKPTQGPPR